MLRLILLPFFLVFTTVHASIENEIALFQSQVANAAVLVKSTAEQMKARYKQGRGDIGVTVVDYNTANAVDYLTNPIKTIRYGYVDTTTQTGTFKSAGRDNYGQYVIEVAFKGKTEKADISPSLDGRTVLFIATGGENNLIYTNSSPDSKEGFEYLKGGAVPSSMTSIKGFICRLKTAYATSVTGSYPYQQQNGSFKTNIDHSVDGTDVDSYAGKLVLDEDTTSSGASVSINLFSYTIGPAYSMFAACSDANAPYNDNAAVTPAA